MDSRKKTEEKTQNEAQTLYLRKRLHKPGSSKGARIMPNSDSSLKPPKPSFTIFEASPNHAEIPGLPRVSIEEESPRVDCLRINPPKK